MADDIMMSTGTHQSSSRVLAGGGGSSSTARFATHDDHTSGGFAIATTESEDQQQNEVLLSVVLSSGRQHDIRVSRDITVRKLKQICIPKHIQDKRLSGFEEATGGVPGAVASPAGVSDEDDESRFKLVHANSGRCLADAQSLSDQSIVHSDSLLLLPRKTKPHQVTSMKIVDAAGRPASVTVDQLTSSIDGKNLTRNTRKDSNFNNYLTEMRKIILSLIYVSHRLLCHNKEAIDMFREAIVLLKAARASDERQSLMSQGNKKISSYSLASSAGRSSDVSIRTSTSSSAISSSSSQPSNSAGGGGGGTREHTQVHVDSDLVKQLTDMGFKPQLSKLALVLNGMSVSMATEWLLAHGDDEEMQDEDTTAAILLSQQTPSPTPPNYTTQGSPVDHQFITNSRSDSSGEQPMDIDASSAVASESDECNTSEELLQCSDGLKVLQEFHQLSFQPEPKALKSLLDMGFPEQESCDALRVNGNHEHMACEWLLTWPRRPSVEEWEEGIDASSPMYKAIVSNPLVQLLLNNPKTLLALEDILGHPNSMSHYLNDPDAGPLLVQISSIFSTERNATSSSSTSSGSESTSSTTTTTTAVESANTEQQAVASSSGNESVQRGDQRSVDSSHNNANEESMITQMEDDDDDSLSTLI